MPAFQCNGSHILPREGVFMRTAEVGNAALSVPPAILRWGSFANPGRLIPIGARRALLSNTLRSKHLSSIPCRGRRPRRPVPHLQISGIYRITPCRDRPPGRSVPHRNKLLIDKHISICFNKYRYIGRECWVIADSAHSVPIISKKFSAGIGGIES